MKYYLLLYYLLAIVWRVDGQVSSQNYIQTRMMLNDTGSQYLDVVNYVDGLGRPFMELQKNVVSSGKHLISLTEYDAYDHAFKQWLPIETTSDYQSPSIFKSSAPVMYGNDSRPFTESFYEASVQNRFLKQYGPGIAWSTHPVESSYYLNSLSSPYNCKLYTVGSSGLSENGFFPAGELFIEKATDEDLNVIYTFSDKEDHVLLIRQIHNMITYDTYYVYDNYGNLRYVLPPMYQENADLNLYAYQYKYDSCRRCIEKKLPGCDIVKYIYDQTNNLVFSQDGIQRRKSIPEWTFYLHDVFNRLTVQGSCTNTDAFYAVNKMQVSTLVTDAKGIVATGLGNSGYTSTFALQSPVVHLVNYYDTYSFRSLSGFNNSNYPAAIENATGLQTGSVISVLGSDLKLYTATYFDSKGRNAKVVTSNHLGGYDMTNMSYTFIGKLSVLQHSHTATGKKEQIEEYSYTYDNVGRLLTTKYKLNSGVEMLLVNNEYDSLGRLKSNKRNGVVNLKTDYTYNIRSWVNTITNPLLNLTLYYNDQPTNMSNKPCFNGNISALDWRANDGKQRGYNFVYDNLSRLISADYLENNVATDKFSTSYAYDKHGNILSLVRNGNIGTTTYGVIDNLNLSYHGNQLIKVEDKGSNPSLSMSMDFKDGAHEDIEYGYDANGNQIKDLNKGISNIEYNSLNLPKKITFKGANNPVNEYVYSADGCKLSVSHVASVTKRTDYVGNMIYENGVLKRILVDGGYIEDGVCYYYLQDHLGNNRVVAKADGTVVQTSHYYPYGMAFAESTDADKQPYKYNNKELDTENGLNLYDYGNRSYDSALGRLTTMDRFSEKYYSLSPYQYAANNPVNNLDINGDSIWFTAQYDNSQLTGLTMHVTGKVLNDSNEKINMEDATKNIATAIERAYKDDDDISFNTDIQLSVAQSMDDISESDHLFVLTDKIVEVKDGEVYGASNYMGGKVAFINAAYFSGIYDETLGSRSYGSFTAAHEFGHLAGLLHDKSPINIMRSNGTFYGIKSSQLRTIQNKWINKKLNQGPNYMLDQLGRKRPNTGNAHIYVKTW